MPRSRYCWSRCGGMSNSLREQLKANYNASQQAAIASVMCPGQALFTLLQVGKFLCSQITTFHACICVSNSIHTCVLLIHVITPCNQLHCTHKKVICTCAQQYTYMSSAIICHDILSSIDIICRMLKQTACPWHADWSILRFVYVYLSL